MFRKGGELRILLAIVIATSIDQANHTGLHQVFHVHMFRQSLMDSRRHVVDLRQFPQHEFVSFFGGFAARAVGYFWICHSIPLFVRRLLTLAIGKCISVPKSRTSLFNGEPPGTAPASRAESRRAR